MISRPSLDLMVIIDTSALLLNLSDKSLCSLFTTTATASFAKPGPIDLAKSSPLLPFGRLFFDPSGNVMSIVSTQFSR